MDKLRLTNVYVSGTDLDKDILRITEFGNIRAIFKNHFTKFHDEYLEVNSTNEFNVLLDKIPELSSYNKRQLSIKFGLFCISFKAGTIKDEISKILR